jgi:hypothetical protein
VHDKLNLLIQAVRAAEPELDAQTIADMLWLATFADQAWGWRRAAADDATPPPSDGHRESESTSDTSPEQPVAGDGTELFDGSGGETPRRPSPAGRCSFHPRTAYRTRSG